MIQNLEQAIELLRRYGNVTTSAKQLKAIAPTPFQLRDAASQAHNAVDSAVLIIAQYHSVEFKLENNKKK